MASLDRLVFRAIDTVIVLLLAARCLLVLVGSVQQLHVNATNLAPVTRIPMIWVFGAVFPISIMVIVGQFDLSILRGL